jgi:hypothetical protein
MTGSIVCYMTTESFRVINIIMSTLKKIPTIEDFFCDEPNSPWKSFPKHRLEQSPCYPVIGRRTYYGRSIPELCNIDWYYCKLHPYVESIHLESIELHCKYKEPDKHKTRILEFLQQLLLNYGIGAK